MRALAVALLAVACSFAPDIPTGSIRCGDDGACPAGSSCGADLVCHTAGEPATQSGAEPPAGDAATLPSDASPQPICGIAACAALNAQCGTIRDACDHDVACPPCPTGYKCSLHVCVPG
jgi:hypothetical protein